VPPRTLLRRASLLPSKIGHCRHEGVIALPRRAGECLGLPLFMCVSDLCAGLMITRFCVLAIAALGLAGCASYQGSPGYPAYPYYYGYAGWWDDDFEHFHDDDLHCHDHGDDQFCHEHDHEHDHEMGCDHDHGSCFDHREDPRQDMMNRQRENERRPDGFASTRDHPTEQRFSPNSRPMPPAVEARPSQPPIFLPTAPAPANRSGRVR